MDRSGKTLDRSGFERALNPHVKATSYPLTMFPPKRCIGTRIHGLHGLYLRGRLLGIQLQGLSKEET